jgi:hypothetical protein
MDNLFLDCAADRDVRRLCHPPTINAVVPFIGSGSLLSTPNENYIAAGAGISRRTLRWRAISWNRCLSDKQQPSIHPAWNVKRMILRTKMSSGSFPRIAGRNGVVECEPNNGKPRG